MNIKLESQRTFNEEKLMNIKLVNQKEQPKVCVLGEREGLVSSEFLLNN